MNARALTDAIEGHSVLVSETGIEPLQLTGRVGSAAFLLGGSRRGSEQLPSGPNPYQLLAASLGACTAMTIRLYADRNELSLSRIQVSVVLHRDKKGGRNTFDRRVFLEGFLTGSQRAALMQVAEQCPVARSLAPGAEIRTYVELSPDEWSHPAPEQNFDTADAWWLDAMPDSAD